jgi:hypothetical protein
MHDGTEVPDLKTMGRKDLVIACIPLNQELLPVANPGMSRIKIRLTPNIGLKHAIQNRLP